MMAAEVVEEKRTTEPAKYKIVEFVGDVGVQERWVGEAELLEELAASGKRLKEHRIRSVYATYEEAAKE